MSPYVGPKEIIRIVAAGIQRNDPDKRVIEELASKGVPPHDAQRMFSSIRTAIQDGAQSVIARGQSAPKVPPKDPLLAEAFKVGQKSIRSDLSGSGFRRFLLVLVVVTLIVLILVLVLP